MPGYLLDAGALVLCAHGGRVTPMSPGGRVTVVGRPISTAAAPHPVSGCPHTNAGSPEPCVVAVWTGGAGRVRSLGQPVLLHDSPATCAPNGTAVTVAATQPRVRGI